MKPNDLTAPLLLTRIADALERIAAAAERAPLTAPAIEAPRARRKAKNDAPGPEADAGAAPAARDPASLGTPVDINDDEAMRAHAGERISQLVTQASEAGCSTADIDELIADNIGSADPASVDLTTLSKVITGLMRLIKSHSTPAEESESDKQIRAETLGQIRTLTQHAAATGEGLTATIAIMREYGSGNGDVDHLDLPKLQALLAAMAATASSSIQASAS